MQSSNKGKHSLVRLQLRVVILSCCTVLALSLLFAMFFVYHKLERNFRKHDAAVAWKRIAKANEQRYLLTQNKFDEFAKTVQAENKLFQPLGDLRTLPERNDAAHVICFVFSTILSTGGVEQWFWSLYHNVYTKNPYTVYAIQIQDIYNHDVVKKVSQEGLRFNPGNQALVEQCDIIIQTGTTPLGDFRYARKVPRILVIHGSTGCKWTERYTRHAASYDKIVAVSYDAINTLPMEHRGRAHMIPSGIDPKRLESKMSKDDMFQLWNLPKANKVLLYMGRISSEKEPQFFIDTVTNLPQDWIGVMVGPMYFEQSLPEMTNNRTFMVGRHDNPADAYHIADVVLLPSKSEGGPIVLLESWPLRKPFFMRRTGLARQHPEGVFMIEDTDTPESVAKRIAFVDEYKHFPDIRSTMDHGYRIYNETYRIDITAAKWQKVLNDTMDEVRKTVLPLLVTHTMTDINVKVVGRTRLITTGEKHEDHMVHLNVMQTINIAECSNVKTTVEYIVEKSGLVDHMGYARWFYFDANYVQVDAIKQELKSRKQKHVLRSTIELPRDVKGFYLSLDLLEQIQMRLLHVGVQCIK